MLCSSFDQKCLVTGASSGIGKATCQVLTKNGALVVGTGRNQKSLETMKENGHIVDYVVADVTVTGECERLVNKAVEILGGLTTVVNAAGVLYGGAMGDSGVDLENYMKNMSCNTQAPFEIMVHATPYLKASGEDLPRSIVNVSSVNGKQAFASCVSYCMSKAAVDQLTRCASVDLAKYGIRVNAVNPGVIETNLQKVSALYLLEFSG